MALAACCVDGGGGWFGGLASGLVGVEGPGGDSVRPGGSIVRCFGRPGCAHLTVDCESGGAEGPFCMAAVPMGAVQHAEKFASTKRMGPQIVATMSKHPCQPETTVK